MPKPIPPVHLRMRVSLLADEGDWGSSGWSSAYDFRRALSGVGVHLQGHASTILDWGCGCGRTLSQIPFEFDKHEVHGCDIDGEAVAWLQENYPAFHVVQSAELPPLPYRDGYFDLILNHSVLTHLDEAHQDAWLAELGRILKPDGVLVLTVMGPHALQLWLAGLPPELATEELVERVHGSLEKDGLYFHVDDAWAADFPGYYQSTFHAPWYIFEHWTRYFDILSYVPRGSLAHQDMILLRHKRDLACRASSESEASAPRSRGRAPARLASTMNLRRRTPEAAVLVEDAAEEAVRPAASGHAAQAEAEIFAARKLSSIRHRFFMQRQ